MGYRILIADDEAEIRDLLRLYLEKDGYEVLEAADGLENDGTGKEGGTGSAAFGYYDAGTGWIPCVT